MSVGGDIIEIRRWDLDTLWICVCGVPDHRGGKHWSGHTACDEVSIKVLNPVSDDRALALGYAELDDELSCGDTIWWQGHKALWTPASERVRDFSLTKVGYSWSPGPEQKLKIRHREPFITIRPMLKY